jgi:hypothetical protein
MARTPDFSHEAKLDHEKLVEVLDYNAETGMARWKKRPKEHFRDHHTWYQWNDRFAGRVAGGYTYKLNYTISVFGQHYRAERLFVFYVTQRWPSDVSFKNGDKTDFRYENLKATFPHPTRVRLHTPRPNVEWGKIHYFTKRARERAT